MSLSAEALVQLEGLDLREAREGLNFASGAEIRQPIGADLSDDELAGLRNWDLSGMMARLNGLTFEPPPAEPAGETASVPGVEEGLPDWLRPAEETAPEVVAEPPVEETVEPAPLPEQPAAPSGPTAEEAAAGLAAAEVAGLGTQVINGGEVVIPPAGDRRREKLSISVEGMKQALKNYLSTWLDRKKLSLAGEFTGGTAAGFLANLCFTELYTKNPQMAAVLPQILTGMQLFTTGTTNLIETGVLDILILRKKSELAEKFTRASKFAERIAVTFSADGLIDRSLLLGATTVRGARDVFIRPGAAGFTAGAWLYAGLASAGVFGADHSLINPVAAAGGENVAGGGATDGVASGNVDHPSQWPTAGVGTVAAHPAAEAVYPVGSGPDVNIPGAAGGTDVSPGLPDGGEVGGIDSEMRSLVNSLSTEQTVANLSVDQQVGASHWTLAEQWGKPLADKFFLTPAGRTFFTDAIKDITQDQGGVSPFGSPINYDKAQIGAYLQSAIGRIRDLPTESMQVKVTKNDIDGLESIAKLLAGS